ncbi:ABC transporter ATP-binding protein [Arthrobacter sp. YC-RL1]|uniref:ABC transporter ATP-binding protein n=1 Tax=Arthrobacter sp. YC-RL1 TaxID=1652545 RepID=UPI00063DB033|nr:ABC transporter ATP-binding protein [Arthrobacter sp. YC-RL1]ALQ29624.1 ABC transporter ATP-binding protein [Arthrobacter sp. YC-RL1]KLI89013.1 ABC transporter ATP-binding protein [Arthrobacter sp. YC-RL1]
METLNRTEAVSLTGLRKTFTTPRTKVEAVRGVDLSIQAGQIVALLGPNGAGKTTTVDMILGLTQPSSGSVEVLGLSPHRAVTSGRVSAVLQTGGLLRDLTVRETITVIATMHGQAGRVTQVMDRTGLTAIAKRRVGKCSGGEQQRIKFALALLPDPDVLILDEPTAGMDVMARRDFWENMRSEASSGRTIIFATHYLEEAQNFAERTVLMSHGRIVADGATEELRKLISGRTVSATLPTEQAISQAEAFDASVSIAERNGQRISFKCADSDRFAQTLLTDLGAWDLEISAPSLEDAFIQLTEDAQ